ncbi:MAG: hypothetical protein WCF16_01340 [Alphaproteobacteria bacterium]
MENSGSWLQRAVRLGPALALLVLALPGVGAAANDPDDLERQRRAVRYLEASQTPSGLFAFDTHFLSGTGEGSSVVDTTAFLARQASAAYGLSKYYVQSGDETVRPVLEKALAGFGTMSLPLAKSPLLRALEASRLMSISITRRVLTRVLEGSQRLYRASGDGQVLSYDPDYGSAWAGTTAIALLAELGYERASGDTRFAELRRAWLAGLMSLYVPGRGFREFPDTLSETAYANGEAWLALATYVGMFPDDARAAKTLHTIDDYMMRAYSERLNLQFFHWGAMAAARRYADTSDGRFLDFLRDQAGRLAEILPPRAEREANSCAFVEGLAAAAAALSSHEPDRPIVARISDRIDSEMAKNRELQIAPGQDRIDYPRGASLRAPLLADFAGAFLMDRFVPYTRIDITDHCISAISEMQRIKAAP